MLTPITKTRLIVAALSVATVIGCGADFAPYNQLNEGRLLAIRAEPPAIGPTETATIDALVYDAGGQPVQYAWSWCPFRGGPEVGYDCIVSESEFAAMLGVDPGTVDFDLGTNPTASLSYLGTKEALAAVCASPTLPASHCLHGLPISVGLTVTIGDATIVGFKDLHLVVDDTVPANENPSIDALSIAPHGAAKSDATLVEPTGSDASVHTSESYELYVDVADASIESFIVPASGIETESRTLREMLNITWHVTGGETHSIRTSFLDGELDLDDLSHNSWELPSVDETSADAVEVIAVIRDERGGVSWLRRTLSLVRN